VITFDESVDTDTTNGGGHVITVVISPQAKQGFQSSTLYQHQNLLRTVDEALGVSTHPGAAATAADMSEFFTTTPNTAPAAGMSAPTASAVAIDAAAWPLGNVFHPTLTDFNTRALTTLTEDEAPTSAISMARGGRVGSHGSIP